MAPTSELGKAEGSKARVRQREGNHLETTHGKGVPRGRGRRKPKKKEQKLRRKTKKKEKIFTHPMHRCRGCL
jgi:hypothetical protein